MKTLEELKAGATVCDLSREELEELAQRHMIEQANEDARDDPSYSELAEALDIVGYDTLRREYAGTTFSPDDFFCNC